MTIIEKNGGLMKFGIIAEGKKPIDSRTPLTPKQCAHLKQKYPQAEIVVQTSSIRCYSDQEYIDVGIQIVESVDDCDVLLGVKEVPIANLISDKTYLFFSHTIKKQSYNRELLRTILKKNITLVDYECLVDDSGARVIAFGRWAGIVGAHNGLWTYGKKHGNINLPRANEVKDYSELKSVYKEVRIPPMKIAITGNGRVAQGTWEIMETAGIELVDPYEFLTLNEVDRPIYTRLFVHDLYRKPDGSAYNQSNFYSNPEDYASRFAPFSQTTDLLINAIYWNPAAPVYFTKEEMKSPNFKINTIADITCDIEGSVPATLKATSISDPVMGYDAQSETEMTPFSEGSIDIMSIDNLPNELPRDASREFGEAMTEYVFEGLLKDHDDMIYRASIAKNGMLTEKYFYLKDYVGEL